MKIGLVTGEYPPLEGGVGAFTQELAKELHQLGHEVHIITHSDVRVKDKTRATSIREAWQKINALREPVELPFAYLHPRGRNWRWGDMSQIADIAIRYNLDIVNVQYQAAAYNMRSGAINFLPWRLRGIVPTVVTFHDLRVPYLFPKAGLLRTKVVRRLAKTADGAIVTNRADEAIAQQYGAQALKNIPIGSNITIHKATPLENEAFLSPLNLPEKHFLLAYFGFLNESKGADTLVQAMAGLEEKYHLLFIGGRTGASDTDNNQLFMNNINQLVSASQLDEQIHWTGFMSDQRVSTALTTADLVVLPYKDGVSLRRGTLMAALAHGCPIVSTTPTHPIPELEHGHNIWLVPPDDDQALAEAIQHLQNNPDVRQALAQAAQETSQQFGWEPIARQTADFLQEIYLNQKDE